jgi:zinc protease
MVYFNINIRGGHLFENGKIESGTAAMLAAMLNEGTEKYTSAQLGDELAKLGSSINFNGSGHSISCNVQCFNDKVPQTMALLEEMLFHPRFDEKDFKTNRKQILENITNNRTSANFLTNKAFLRLVYGDDNPLGTVSLGDYRTASKIGLDDIKSFYNELLSPNLTNIIITGDIGKEAAGGVDRAGQLSSADRRRAGDDRRGKLYGDLCRRHSRDVVAHSRNAGLGCRHA